MVLVKTMEDGTQISHRLSQSNHEAAKLELHPVPEKGLIVKVEPPREPSIPIEHVPCDIVLVIDVSGSMIADAPVPTKPGEEAERNGLTVLDLVKHAARTIVETLNDNDRLAIVTFASASTVLQGLLPMTAENKVTTDEKIGSMQPQDATNLWHGIRDGLKLFKNDEHTDKPQRIPALMVLTDGCPNHMCPVQGYVPKLRSMGKLPAIINTFGFGYTLRSGLLKSIAEVSGGSYAFIPDAGMVGTVFVHAVANLQSTFAQNAILKLTYPSNILVPSPQTADQTPAIKLPDNHPLGKDYSELTLPLHNLQYGQSRDIYLEYSSWKSSSPITATLTYQRLNQHPETLPQSTLHPSAPPPSPAYSPAEAAYHISRSKIVSFLLNLSPPSTTDEERTPLSPLPEDIPAKLTDLIATLPCNNINTNPTDPLNESLLQDLNGQISLALNNTEYYNKWGLHYLPSLADAHAKQICNSFKDPGPLMYGSDSPLFLACRDRLDAKFDELPPPKPSVDFSGPIGELLRRRGGIGTHGTGPGMGSAVVAERDRYNRRRGSLDTDGPGDGVATPDSTDDGGSSSSWWADFKMSSYNSRDNPCFAGCVRVLLAGGGDGVEDGEGKGKRPLTPTDMETEMDCDDDGEEEFPWMDGQDNRHQGRTIKIGKLRAGMRVQTPRGPRRVVAVLKTTVRKQEMCLVGRGLLVTPWHPVSLPTTTTLSTGVSSSSQAGPGAWIFPRDVSRRKVRYTGSIYSVLLERDADAAAHAVFVGGAWGVTLGHGLVPSRYQHNTTGGTSKFEADVRVHPFFGDYGAVVRSLERLHRNSGGLVLGGGVKRDERTGLVDGFRRLSGEEVRRVVDEMTAGAGAKARVQSRSIARSSTASSHASSSSRAETCMWRRTVGCI